MPVKPSLRHEGKQAPRLQPRRQLNPDRLRAARLAAGYDKVAAVCRLIGIKRLAYTRWETQPGLVYFDYVAFANALELFGVTYDAVSDPLPDSAPAQASA